MSIDELKAAHEHLGHALAHISAGRSDGASQRVGLARACIERAMQSEIDPLANPTGATGAQSSNGQRPRDYSREGLRRRDQDIAVRAAYERRMALEGGRR